MKKIELLFVSYFDIITSRMDSLNDWWCYYAKEIMENDSIKDQDSIISFKEQLTKILSSPSRNISQHFIMLSNNLNLFQQFSQCFPDNLFDVNGEKFRIKTNCSNKNYTLFRVTFVINIEGILYVYVNGIDL
jgi:hypothetical protein